MLKVCEAKLDFYAPRSEREKERENSIHLVKLLTILKMLNAVLYIYIRTIAAELL